MAAPSGLSLDPPQPPTTTEVCQWLKNLPLAPEYRPTLSEFQDPIAYIFKIEKEASQYGICKIIPPVLPSAKKTTLSNLNRSLCARNGGSSAPTFTTRQQQIGFCPRKPRPVQKPVWQSGETYTFQEFETKARTFEKNYLKKFSKKGALSPLEFETLYWKATLDKPFSVEYANDMPGSAFSPRKKDGQGGVVGEGMSVGETEWNMRGVSRAKGSLLRFMKEEIPGVTSPMVYIGMMFSWFAWHVEDHDLHSLNYMHMGAGKTWYGVPREAAVAFEEVVRVHGYGGEINPLVTFSVLGEKTTVMSPEVFISAGVPCCRLVQNAGEFVVTFPRAYHSGFSHGFNCGEAANIATPEWLMVAKDAAIRRASINYPPMVSHFQLLYDLALEFCTRIPVNISAKPRSSRLKDKQKGEGEMLVKEQFVKNMIQNNDLLHILGKGSSVVLLPRSSSDISVCSKLRVGSQLRDSPTLGLCSQKDVMKSSKSSGSGDILQDKDQEINQVKGFFSVKAKFASLCERNRFSILNGNECSESMNIGTGRGSSIHGDKLSDQRLFSCVTCGVLSFDCLAIIQPKEAASRYLMSADCSFFNDWAIGSGVTRDVFAVAGGIANISEQNSSRWVEKNTTAGFYDVPVQSPNYHIQMADQGVEVASSSAKQLEASALGLLALNYGNSSDSEEDQVEADLSHHDEIKMTNHSLENKYHCQSSAFPTSKQKYCDAATAGLRQSPSSLDEQDDVPLKANDMYQEHGDRGDNLKDKTDDTLKSSFGFPTGNPASIESNILDGRYRDPMSMPHVSLNCSPIVHDAERTKFNRPIAPLEKPDMPFTQRSDKESSCMHVFCLEHALEIEQQLSQIGGVHILLLCHPEYPRIEGEAKLVSEELGIDYLWNDITFRDAAKEDEEWIQSALDSEVAIPGNGDWAVKLGINLFYSANLSRSPFYSKQMPYNSVIYNAFGLASSVSSPPKFKVYGRRSGKPKKVVAGKWCGKVWMSNQVHPFLAIRDHMDPDHEQEQERSFHALATPDEKLEKKPQTSNRTETTRKSGKKRKITAGSRSIKKVKCLEAKEPDSEDSMGDNCHRQRVRVHNSKNNEDAEREISYDLVPDSHQQHGRCRRKWAKSVESDDAVSDDPLAEHVRQQYRRMRRSKQDKPIKRENTASYASVENKFQKQLKRVHRSDRAKFFKRQSVASDDSLDGNSDQWHERATRRTQAKYAESEDAISDDSPEESSRWLHGRVLKSKQLKYIDEEGAISDDSLESGSHQHNRRVSRGTRVQLIKRNDMVSDDSLDESSYQRLPRFSRSKLAKLIERENAVSDDSLDDNIHQQHGRILKSKQAKFVEGEDAISDDSLEDNTDWQRKRIPRRKMAKFVESEDAASDDLQEEDTHQHRRRIPKSKKANFIEREVVISDDLWGNNAHRHSRKTPRSKQARFIEREDLVSDDLLEDDSDQQEKSILRSKQKKSATFCQMKRGIPRKPKCIAPKMMKKETLQSMKQERRIKQETPQLRIGKSELNARQFDLRAEEGLEGGPSTRLRKRPSKPPKQSGTKLKEKQQNSRKKLKDASAAKAPVGRKNVKIKDEEAEYQCDIDGCTMGFGSKQELALHKRNICPVKGCGKKFFSHKYLVQHRRVHIDDRPLKCPWKGCKMTFKWAWARTEHIRVHTGARPYVCAEEGCGQTFRFVSDFSRHKRKTGHSAKKGRG